jgi:hypothetical protein
LPATIKSDLLRRGARDALRLAAQRRHALADRRSIAPSRPAPIVDLFRQRVEGGDQRRAASVGS